MAIYDEMRTPGSAGIPANRWCFCDNNWMPLSWAEPCLQTYLLTMTHQPFGTRVQVLPMLGLRGDARKPNVLAQLVDKSRLIAFQIFKNCLHGQRFSRPAIGSNPRTTELRGLRPGRMRSSRAVPLGSSR